MPIIAAEEHRVSFAGNERRLKAGDDVRLNVGIFSSDMAQSGLRERLGVTIESAHV